MDFIDKFKINLNNNFFDYIKNYIHLGLNNFFSTKIIL